MPKLITTRVLLLKRSELLLSRGADLCVVDNKFDEKSQLWERGHAAADLRVVEGDSPKLSEVLEEGEAAAHLGVVEVELLKLGEILKE